MFMCVYTEKTDRGPSYKDERRDRLNANDYEFKTRCKWRNKTHGHYTERGDPAWEDQATECAKIQETIEML